MTPENALFNLNKSENLFVEYIKMVLSRHVITCVSYLPWIHKDTK